MTYSDAPRPPRPGSAQDAVVYGWRKLMGQPGPWIGFTALAAVLTGVAVGLGVRALAGGAWTDPTALLGWSGGFSVRHVLGTLVATFVQVFVLALLVRAALYATGMTRIAFSDFFELPEPVPVAALALVTGVVHLVLSVVPVLGAVVATLLWLPVTLVLLVMLDGRLPLVPALRAALALARRRTPTLLVLWILVTLINAVGLFLCGVGLLVTLPATVIAQAAAVRVLGGRGVL